METTTKRRPGRPVVDERQPSRIDAVVPPETRRQARVAAAMADMTLGAWVAQAIEEKLARDAEPRP